MHAKKLHFAFLHFFSPDRKLLYRLQPNLFLFCTCVYMHVCMHALVRAPKRMRMQAWVYASMHGDRMHAWLRTCKHAYVHALECVCVHVHVWFAPMHACMCMCVHVSHTFVGACVLREERERCRCMCMHSRCLHVYIDAWVVVCVQSYIHICIPKICVFP